MNTFQKSFKKLIANNNFKLNKFLFKQFASSNTNKTLEFSDKNDWETEVNKSDVPVLVDCYAE